LALGQSNQIQAMLHLLLEADSVEIHVNQISAEKPKRKIKINLTHNCSTLLKINIKEYNMHSMS
jgi:hypothetical protein